MHNLLLATRVARIQLTRGLGQAKIWIALLFVPLVLQPALSPALAMAMDVNEPVTIMGVVFVFSDIYNSALSVLFGTGAVLLFSDAPFFDAQQQQCLLRVGRRVWILGQLLYILCLSLLYTFYWVLWTGIILAPRFSWILEWGTVWKTLAFTDAARQYGLTLDCPISLIRAYPPLQSLLLSITLKISLCLLFGSLCFMLSLWTRTNAGIYLCLALVMQDYMTMNGMGLRYIWFAPASMSRLSMLDHIGTGFQPMPWQAMVIFLAVISTCVFLSYASPRNVFPE